MFKVMRAAFLIHKGNLQDASVMPAETVLRMATIDAAKAIRMDNLIGSLTPRKKADMITLNLSAPTPVTPENVITHIVVFGDGSMVENVIINGKQIVKHKKVLTTDEKVTRQRCMEAAAELWKT